MVPMLCLDENMIIMIEQEEYQSIYGRYEIALSLKIWVIWDQLK